MFGIVGGVFASGKPQFSKSTVLQPLKVIDLSQLQTKYLFKCLWTKLCLREQGLSKDRPPTRRVAGALHQRGGFSQGFAPAAGPSGDKCPADLQIESIGRNRNSRLEVNRK